jgi:hypothetical protein
VSSPSRNKALRRLVCSLMITGPPPKIYEVRDILRSTVYNLSPHGYQQQQRSTVLTSGPDPDSHRRGHGCSLPDGVPRSTIPIGSCDSPPTPHRLLPSPLLAWLQMIDIRSFSYA